MSEKVKTAKSTETLKWLFRQALMTESRQEFNRVVDCTFLSELMNNLKTKPTITNPARRTGFFKTK